LFILATFQFVRSAFSPNGHGIREATIVGVAYLENWNTVFQWAPFDLMGHTWSLAVEEQFYLLWPLAFLFVVKRRSLAWIGATAAAMVLARVICWRAGYAETTLDFCLGIRPVGLLIGCALAFLPIDCWRLPSIAAPAALVAIFLIGLCIASRPVFLLAPAATSLATAVLLVCLQQASPMTAALSLAPIRYIGKISYGVYRYHWPLFMLGEKWKIHAPFHLYAFSLVALIFVAAALSYEFVEKPILGFKRRFQRERRAPQAECLKAA
jgi:peptidoglycan/LPS O-acetylase OafA/YrhL